MSQHFVKEEEEKYILCNIPFTVYSLWKDIRYEKYRLVVKELLTCADLYKGKELYHYKYRII